MIIYLSILFFISAVYFDRVFTAQSIFAERDLPYFFIPPKYLWVTLIKSFDIPLWNPYNYSGIPLIATLQPGVFYPPNVIYIFLPFNIVWNWMIILHFIFAGFNVYVFLRYLKCSSESSFVGGITFTLSGYLLSVHNVLPHLLSVSWFPLVLMFYLRYLEERRIKYMVFTSICLAMQFFAGAPEIVMMTALILIILSGLYPVSGKKVINFYFAIKTLLFIFLIFFLVCSVQLIPFYELLSNSTRKGGLSYQEATTWSLAWKDFIQYFIPNIYGNFQNDVKYWANQSWLKTLYLGITPFVLSVFYFISKDKKRLLLLLLMFISFVFALGDNTPFYKILYHIPPFNSVRYPVKFLFIFFFVISITSGLGYEHLKRGIEENDPRIKKIILAIFYMGFIFALAWGFVALFNHDVYSFFERHNIKPDTYNDINYNIHNIKRFLLFSFLFCTMLLVTLRIKYKRIAFLGIITLISLDLFLANYSCYNTTTWEEYLSKNEFVDKIRNNGTRRYIVSPETNYEFQVFPKDKMVLDSGYAALSGLYTVGGLEVLRVNNYENFMKILYSSKSVEEAKRYFDISGISYLITIHNIKDKEFRRLKSIQVGGKSVYLYEYVAQPGRFLLYRKANYASNDTAIMEKLQNKAINLKEELVIFSKNHGDAKSTINTKHIDKNRKSSVELVSYKPNKLVLDCEASDDAFLYVSDTFYPGWQAYIDGKETKIYRANLTFRAVEVPAGKHVVIFKYVPLSFYIGLCFTLIGIGLSIYLVKRDKKCKDKTKEIA